MHEGNTEVSRQLSQLCRAITIDQERFARIILGLVDSSVGCEINDTVPYIAKKHATHFFGVAEIEILARREDQLGLSNRAKRLHSLAYLPIAAGYQDTLH